MRRIGTLCKRRERFEMSEAVRCSPSRFLVLCELEGIEWLTKPATVAVEGGMAKCIWWAHGGKEWGPAVEWKSKGDSFATSGRVMFELDYPISSQDD